MRKPKPPALEEVEALANRLSKDDQIALARRFMANPDSWLGNYFLTILRHEMNERERLEIRLGILPEPMGKPSQIDPDGLLTTDETDKEAKKRTGLKSTNAVKTARYKARKKIEAEAVPPRSLPLR
jgi:hypothetical protein